MDISEKTYSVEFSMCSHPELYPTDWGQEKPEPVRTIGSCPVHDYWCPVCGFGVGRAPKCDCPEMRGQLGYSASSIETV